LTLAWNGNWPSQPGFQYGAGRYIDALPAGQQGGTYAYRRAGPEAGPATDQAADGRRPGSATGRAARFVTALRDPDGANLDRLQMVKGWIDKKGDTHERIYDVAVSDGRAIGKDGRARKSVGSTVDIDKATFTNAIGAPMLGAHWEDPDFDPQQDAFYYVRVLEIPTPRWTTHDAAFFDIKRPDNVPATVQDRAYTSPVWYSAK